MRLLAEKKRVQQTFWGDELKKADMLVTNGVVLAARHSTGEIQHVHGRIVSRDGFEGLSSRGRLGRQERRVVRVGVRATGIATVSKLRLFSRAFA
jgi:hypothetical protein